MARFLAAFLLLILLVQSAPLLPLQAGGCSMPCCKRSGGRAACCPRPSTMSRQGSAGGGTCRMVACDAEARESTSIGMHLPAVLTETASLEDLLLPDPSTTLNAVRPGRFAEHPPTPPPRFLHI